MSISRRDFIKWSATAGAWMYVSGATGSSSLLERAFAAPIPGGTLDPGDVPKYVIPMLIPPVMPKAGTIRRKGGNHADYYEVSMRQFPQQVLPPPLPATTLWGYGAVKAQDKRGLLIHNAPSLTIEARHRRPVRIKWINELVGDDGNYLPHLFPVDQTLHWANPPGGMAGRDTRPVFTETPPSYEGPVPMCTHVHGAVGVGDESDGYAEAWYLPDADDIPEDYATKGTWYDFFASKAKAAHGVEWGPGYATFEYPNLNRASTIWYHDHTLGMTRVNVYAGPAGFFLIRGGADDQPRDSRNKKKAVLPGPAPRENDRFPSNKTYYEIPIALQDRAFNDDGSLFYPGSREFFDGAPAPYVPFTDLSPIWNPEFFGNMIIANGNTWPFQTVERRRYRLRFLNGCQSRFLILDFNQIPGVEVWQIGNEGGFLSAPVNLTEDNGNRLLLALAERADLIVDFTNVVPGSYVLANVGPDEPFGGGTPDVDFAAADPGSTGQIMQFRVVPATSPDRTTPPEFLALPPIAPLPAETVTRPLALIEEMSQFYDGPAEALLGTVAFEGSEGVWTKRLWMEEVTENPEVGTTEVWEFYNTTGDAHPMHVHELVFEVIDRQGILVDEMNGTVALTGEATPREPWESGFKDTVVAYPGQVTRVRAQFNTPGQYVWHCHIVEHEDNEMMRPFRIGPPQMGQPGDM